MFSKEELQDLNDACVYAAIAVQDNDNRDDYERFCFIASKVRREITESNKEG